MSVTLDDVRTLNGHTICQGCSTHSRPASVDDLVAVLRGRGFLVVEAKSFLEDVIEDLSGWGAYASDYFKEKWDLPGDIARYQKMLDDALAVEVDPK